MRAQPPSVAHQSARAVGLIGLVGATLGLEVLLQTPLGFPQPLLARRRDRPGLLGSPLFEPTLGLGQPLRAPRAGRELLRQFVAATLAEALVLLAIDRVGLGEDLARDLLVVAGGALGRVRVNLRPVDRDHADLAPGRPRRRARAPRRTGRPAPSRDAGGSARSSCGRAPGWRRSRASPRPRYSAARSAATTAHRPRSSRATAPPSSPDRAPPARARPPDRRHRTRPDRTAPPRRSQTTRGDPPAATRAGSAATTTPARDHTPGSSAACRHRLNHAGQTAPLCNSLHG